MVAYFRPLHATKINYVNMQQSYDNMKLIDVNMQHNYMYVDIRHDFVNMQDKLICLQRMYAA